MTTRPNVLFILSDQHNAKVLGHTGHPDVKTPHLDRLAAEGVRFDACISQNPICTPSRVSFLSGQYPHNHGCYANQGPRPDGLPTILGHFRHAGYRTSAVGKIHCPEYWVEDDCDTFREVYPNCSIAQSSGYDDYLDAKGLLDDRDDGLYPECGSTCDARVSRLAYDDSVEAWATRESIAHIERAANDRRPFFAFVGLPRPHTMYCPSEPFWSMYDEATLTFPPNLDYDMTRKAPHLRQAAEAWRRERPNWWPVWEPKTVEAARRRKLHGYLGCVSQVDHAVGQMLDWLDANGLADDTIVIYTSDHGDYACEHGNMEKAPGICADAITRIPSIWRWPGRLAAGHVAHEIVEAVDLSATLCALAGLDPLLTSDGKDLSHLLRGDCGHAHTIGVTEFAWSKSVRKGRYRYVYYPVEMFADEYPEGFGELYDLVADPWEMHNLHFDPQFTPVVGELQRDLVDWLVTTTRPRTANIRGDFEGRQSVTRFRRTVTRDGKTPPDWIRQGALRNHL